MIESLDPSHQATRTAAFDRFESAAMPTQKLEQWKYVELDFDLKEVAVAEAPGDVLEPGPFLGSIPEREATVVVIDGTVTDISAGTEAEVKRLAELDSAQLDRVTSLIDDDRDIFASARSAFASDAVVVTAPRGVTVDRPVVVDLQATSASSSFPRVSVVAEENAEIGVIVLIRSAPGARAVVVPQIGLHAEAGARIRYVAVQNVAFEATAVVHQKVEIGRDATVRTGEIGLGGNVGRLDLDVGLDGQGSSAEVVGVYFGEFDQTLDYRMLIHHKGKNSSSDVFLKGAVEDNAQSVFTGLLKIDKGAERTSAFETNRNLVLSEGAKAHSVPNLEIECDDVVCGHGSSVGPLETEHLYYLRSRGLSAERAERLMIKGFFNEIIDRLPVSGLAEPVRDELFARFVEAQREGRVA
jgi:Fe-S cluster assembly protein SufD